MTADAELWRLELPWSVPPLLATDRRHPEAQATLAGNVRLLARLLAIQAALPTGVDRVRVELHWAPPPGRKASARLVKPSLRCVVGGLREFGLAQHISRGCVVEPAESPGRCWLTVEEHGRE